MSTNVTIYCQGLSTKIYISNQKVGRRCFVRRAKQHHLVAARSKLVECAAEAPLVPSYAWWRSSIESFVSLKL